MKTLVLFTRITGQEEWAAWNNPNGGDCFEINTKEHFVAIVHNGQTVLGELPEFNQSTQEQKLQACDFAGKLWEKIEPYKDNPDTLICIHFGNGTNYDQAMNPWMNYFKTQLKAFDAVKILKYFRGMDEPGIKKPVLRHYSTDGNPVNLVAAKRSNLEDWYEELHPDGDAYLERVLNLLHTCHSGGSASLEEGVVIIENGTYSYTGKLDEGKRVKADPQWPQRFNVWNTDKTDTNLAALRDVLLAAY